MSLSKRGKLAALICEHNVDIVMGWDVNLTLMKNLQLLKSFHQILLYFVKIEV